MTGRLLLDIMERTQVDIILASRHYEAFPCTKRRMVVEELWERHDRIYGILTQWTLHNIKRKFPDL